MKGLLLRWVVLAVSIVVASMLVGLVLPGDFVVKLGTVPDLLVLLLGAAVFAVVNGTLGSMIKLVTLPLNCLTLGLVSILVNAAMLFLVGQLGLGFQIKTFWAALLGSLLLSACMAVLSSFVKEKDE
ncbi:MAG: phage holin family protein [Fimbriimonadaceae bacterium]|nr:phage holin family protein [Fimbriimonadaceae bacterium]QYK58632.1 MAG: phage holin family protein [Fimbriimonadaceae bacterium]